VKSGLPKNQPKQTATSAPYPTQTKEQKNNMFHPKIDTIERVGESDIEIEALKDRLFSISMNMSEGNEHQQIFLLQDAIEIMEQLEKLGIKAYFQDGEEPTYEKINYAVD
jgi:hypothetical protein